MRFLRAIKTPYRWLLRRLALKFLGYDHHINGNGEKLVVIKSDGLEGLLNELGERTSVYKVAVDEDGKASLHIYSKPGDEESDAADMEQAPQAPKWDPANRPSLRVEEEPVSGVGAQQKADVEAVLKAAEQMVGRDLRLGVNK